jgi:CRP/FNR family transcriptional regulator, cyclic AMP receptor protein
LPHEKAMMKSPYGLSAECLDCHLRPDDFFCSLSAETLRAFDQIKHASVLPEGAVIFVEGQKPRGIFLLCEGQAKLSNTSNLGNTLILRIARPGEVLGLHAVMTGQPYELTAETMHPCRVNFVGPEDFLQFVKMHGDANLHCTQQVSRNSKHAYDVLRSIGLSHSVSGRVAGFLLDSASGCPVSNGAVRAKLALTHQDIAELTGTCRETITRTLAKFRKKGIVELHGSTLIIHDKLALERLVGT